MQKQTGYRRHSWVQAWMFEYMQCRQGQKSRYCIVSLSRDSNMNWIMPVQASNPYEWPHWITQRNLIMRIRLQYKPGIQKELCHYKDNGTINQKQCCDKWNCSKTSQLDKPTALQRGLTDFYHTYRQYCCIKIYTQYGMEIYPRQKNKPK